MAPIGDLVGEGVLEGVFEIREQAPLVEELGGLQTGEAAAERLLGQLGDGLKEGERHILADHRGGLEQTLLLGGEPVDPGGQNRLDRGGT